MAGGPFDPDSVSLGAGMSQSVYVPSVNTNLAGELQSYSLPCGWPVAETMSLKFNLPEVIPVGTAKLRLLAEALATTGVVNLQVSDAVVAPGANLGAAALTAETATVVTVSAADTLIDTKIPLSSVPVANSILEVVVTFLATSTLAQKSAWQPTLVWE